MKLESLFASTVMLLVLGGMSVLNTGCNDPIKVEVVQPSAGSEHDHDSEHGEHGGEHAGEHSEHAGEHHENDGDSGSHDDSKGSHEGDNDSDKHNDKK